MNDEGKAVFLSYATQDADAARRICETLRAAGAEVWFDQSELTGGDAWDQKIRAQIKACALFVPVISAATQARREGYFRIEWKLAAQRTHAFADGTPFLLPVVIDATRDGEALVPDEFRAVQWTRLPGGEKAEAFGARVKKLLGGEPVDVGPVADRAPSQRPGLQPKVGRRVPAPAWIAQALPSHSRPGDIFGSSLRPNLRRSRRRMRAQGRARPPRPRRRPPRPNPSPCSRSKTSAAIRRGSFSLMG